ncbi:NAD(P)-dependent oxidoreductase [Lichenicoccus sp.]|uniref:NAD(P)-dependent oxidoreductase n=1 Tax=Lichenicoccus sp. TaxID=2781899 RepID=UPI003D134FEB
MRMLILGATGGTGRQIVREGLAAGHAIVALVRSKAKAEGLAGAQLVEGNALDEAAVRSTLDGCDAVICSLGVGLSPFRAVTLLSAATRVLISAMTQSGVRRLVCITGMGAGDSRGHGGFLYDRLFQPLLLRTIYQDKDRQEDAIRASGLDWVILRPTVLTDTPATGRVRAVTDLAGMHGGKISRADVARFAVRQVSSDEWLRKTPLITEAP